MTYWKERGRTWTTRLFIVLLLFAFALVAHAQDGRAAGNPGFWGNLLKWVHDTWDPGPSQWHNAAVIGGAHPADTLVYVRPLAPDNAAHRAGPSSH